MGDSIGSKVSELELQTGPILQKMEASSSVSVITDDATLNAFSAIKESTTASNLIIIIDNKPKPILKLLACTFAIIILTLCTVFNAYCMVSFNMEWNTLGTYIIAVLVSTIIMLDLIQKIRYTGPKPMYISTALVPILAIINIGIGPRGTNSAGLIDKVAAVYVYCYIAAYSTLFLLLLVWIYLPDKNLADNGSSFLNNPDGDPILAFGYVHIIQVIISITYSASVLYYNTQYLLDHKIILAIAIVNAIYTFSITRIVLYLLMMRQCTTESKKFTLCLFVGTLSAFILIVMDLYMGLFNFRVDAVHSIFKGFIILNNGIVTWLITLVVSLVLMWIVILIFHIVCGIWYWFGTYIFGIEGIKLTICAGDVKNTNQGVLGSNDRKI
jgi:hypothetical protein